MSWTDRRCREITEGFVGEQPEHEITGIDRVGSWSVIYDKAKACGNHVMGMGRCIGYAAATSGGSLSFQFIGVPREQADGIVRSVPL